MLNIIRVTYVLLHFSIAINDYNYVLERYSIQPSTNYILMSKLCHAFKLLSICDEYNKNRQNWHRITPTVLEYYPNSIKRRHIFANEWQDHENTAHCICKCCSCPQLSKLKSQNLYKHRRNYERNFQLRKNKLKGRNKYYYMMPLVRKKYKDLRKQQKRRHVKRFWNFGNIVSSVKNTTKNTYTKAGKGFDIAKEYTVHTFHDTYEKAGHGYNSLKNTSINTFQKVGNQFDTVKDSTIHKYNEVHEKVTGDKPSSCEKCVEFLNEVNTKLETLYHNNIVAQWNYEANLTETNKNISIQSDIDFANNMKQNSDKVKAFDKKYNCSSNANMTREIKFLTKLQESALSSEDYKELQNIVRSMEAIYSKAVIKDYHNSNLLHLEPDINDRMAHSRKILELQYIWESWRNETGRKLKMFYPRYVQLMNKSAKLNGFANVAEMWLSVYEQENFKRKIYKVWEEVKPLYQQLHAYVRYKLKMYYGADIVSYQYIPAHLLGNVFGQTWINLYNLTTPFPKHSFPDITTQLQSKGYTPLKMFKEAEKFFKSLGLPSMTEEFWKNSILEAKPNVQMVCHASAWDMQNKKDFRIKMCTHVTYEDFVVIHHEMGHVEYYMLYKDLPIVFREGANPGFHEAIGDTIALSVSAPDHRQSLGLQLDNSDENKINFLFLMALQKIAFLPYALVVESWRWDVFKGNINLENYNEKWWKIRMKYQGIVPPKLRSEDNFDAGAKYHIAAGIPYIRYFVSFIIQFQFHEALCQKSGQLKDGKRLHNCDIYNSIEAGELLRDTLSLGKSVSWSEIMQKFTQTDDISAHSLLMYFDPLQQWLIEENKKIGNKIGWD